MALLPQITCRFSAFSTKICGGFAEIDKLILKVLWKFKGCLNSQNNLIKEATTHMSQYQNLLQKYCDQYSVFLAYRWNVDWWNRIEHPEVKFMAGDFLTKEVGPLPFTIHKSLFEMDHIPKSKF